MNRRAIPETMRFGSWRAGDGWPLRRFEWPAAGPTRGNLLFLGGRGDFVEKYLEALSHWHDRGWSLAGFDWRGQGGSGRYLDDRLVCHIPDFDPLVDDLDAFVAGWKAGTQGPHIIAAHSMGAQIALRLLARRGRVVDGAVLLSPMVGIRPVAAPVAGAAAGIAVRLGLGKRRLWRRDLGNYGGRMTSCPSRQEDKSWWKAARPDIASGAPSWGWLKAAARSMARLRARDLESIAIPLLILASEQDPVIAVSALRRAAARLPDAELRLYAGRGHELLREADRVRLPVLSAIDMFLERTVPPGLATTMDVEDRTQAGRGDSYCNVSPR